MRFIDGETVHARLDYPSLIEALRRHHHDDVDANDGIVFEQPGAAGETTYFLTLPAWQRGKGIGVKLVTVFPENLASDSGLPSVHAIYALFDAGDGRPLAVVDGTALTLRKTAADSGLGAALLARDDARTLLMVGAGALAPHLIMAHKAARPSLTRALVWNRTAERARRLADTLNLEDLAVETTDDLEAAARSADVISCATMTNRPLIRGEWLAPGVHLDLVGGFRPDMREADDAAVGRARVFVDSRWSAVENCGDIAQPLASGALAPDAIEGDLFELCRGARPGRAGADEITLFKNGGGGHLDLMCARFLMERLGQCSLS